ncbi:Gfo/Idh/MocA family oxidoreductase [Parabacteroides sp. PF5-9]|uniref:Gfo/Idh/MocA family protein n=1 Tax=Parabacteroides sp. PF5-9 TaxID=1742404 RepID=UPI0024758538|nr:Gfo/Idh/MocA family oxidoreductase [Parabacteroides sp. PF5-9]MDH6358737.1 putative dehydrogenase [Parabacteroides sp. PF5-9]
MKNRKLKMGMVGGGSDAFIGAIHRRAAFMDNLIELVCGCFSVDPEISKSSGRSYFLPENRIYNTYQEMFEREMALPEEERMDFVTIVTPNRFHFEPAMMALERGFHVVVDKPMTFSLDEAKQLQKKVEETGLILALTHVYSAFPAVKEAKARIARGELGRLRRLYVEYPQGWLAERIELLGGNNAGWRTDPKLSGKAGCMGDIGTHAWHLSEYMTGLKVEELCAELNTFVPGRPIDDDGAAFLRFEGGVKGTLIASQIAIGEANNINIRIYGEKGGLEWHQENPNLLIMKWIDRPSEILQVGNNTFLGEEAKWNTRTPAGHPEGFIEAFANIYRNFALTVMAKLKGETPCADCLDFPTAYDGVRGMQFIETMVAAGYDDHKKWHKWID